MLLITCKVSEDFCKNGEKCFLSGFGKVKSDVRPFFNNVFTQCVAACVSVYICL